MSITLHTAFLMTRAVLPVMAARRYGRIVNVSSVTGPLVSRSRIGSLWCGKGGNRQDDWCGEQSRRPTQASLSTPSRGMDRNRLFLRVRTGGWDGPRRRAAGHSRRDCRGGVFFGLARRFVHHQVQALVVDSSDVPQETKHPDKRMRPGSSAARFRRESPFRSLTRPGAMPSLPLSPAGRSTPSISLFSSFA